MHIKSIIFCLIASFFVLAAPISAAPLGLSLTPSLLTVNIKPGKTVNQTYLIKNLSTQPISLVVRIIPFVPDSTGETPILKPNQKPSWLDYFSLINSDIKFDRSFTLKAHESKQLILSISIPRSANSSDLYASLLLSTDISENTNGSAIGATIGSNIILTVSPMSHPPTIVKIVNFTPQKSSYLFRYGDIFIADNLGKIIISAAAKNFGKYVSQTGGTLKVYRGDKVIYTQNILPTNLLSNSERNLTASPSGNLAYSANITNVGFYSFTIDIGSDNSTTHDEITIFFVPLIATFSAIIVIILTFLILKITRKDVTHSHS